SRSTSRRSGASATGASRSRAPRRRQPRATPSPIPPAVRPMADTPPADDLASAAHRPPPRTPIADRRAALEQAERDRAAAELDAQPPLPVDADLDAYTGEESGGGLGLGIHLSFRSRLTFGLVAASVLPLAGFGIVALVLHDVASSTDTLGRLLLLGLVFAALVGIL